MLCYAMLFAQAAVHCDEIAAASSPAAHAAPPPAAPSAQPAGPLPAVAEERVAEEMVAGEAAEASRHRSAASSFSLYLQARESKERAMIGFMGFSVTKPSALAEDP